jgi:hypothetical protein
MAFLRVYLDKKGKGIFPKTGWIDGVGRVGAVRGGDAFA